MQRKTYERTGHVFKWGLYDITVDSSSWRGISSAFLCCLPKLLDLLTKPEREALFLSYFTHLCQFILRKGSCKHCLLPLKCCLCGVRCVSELFCSLLLLTASSGVLLPVDKSWGPKGVRWLEQPKRSGVFWEQPTWSAEPGTVTGGRAARDLQQVISLSTLSCCTAGSKI